MPGMDGFETASHIKRRERTKDIPIIFLTALDTEPHHAFRGYAAGADDYISKPFDPWVLRAKVSVFVDLYYKNRQIREQAEMLRRRAGGARDSGRVAAELAGRLAAVEEALERLESHARVTPDAAITEGVAQLAQRVARLRDAVDALTA